jgi:hypothetical protein
MKLPRRTFLKFAGTVATASGDIPRTAPPILTTSRANLRLTALRRAVARIIP